MSNHPNRSRYARSGEWVVAEWTFRDSKFGEFRLFKTEERARWYWENCVTEKAVYAVFSLGFGRVIAEKGIRP